MDWIHLDHDRNTSIVVSHTWDVISGLLERLLIPQECLSFMELDD
jgi:hypothetical protein